MFPAITPPNDHARATVRAAMPPVFGRDPLGRAALWLAGCAHKLDNIEHLVIAADHPSADGNTGFSHVTAGQCDFSPHVLDTAQELGVTSRWVQATEQLPAAKPADRMDSMAEQATEHALRQGASLADAMADSGVDLALLGDHGRGLTATAAAIVGAICSVEPVRIVGRGSGIDDWQWRAKTAYIRDAMYRIRDDRASALRVIQRAGTPDLAMQVGFLAQAAARRTPVVFDGAGCAAACLLAHMMAPGASAWWLPATPGTETATQQVVDMVELAPVTNIPLATGQGVGALLTLPMLRHAWRRLPEQAN